MEKQNRALIGGFVGAVAALAVFAWLAHDVVEGQTIAFDASVRNAVHGWASPRLTYAMRGITWLGQPMILIPLGLLLVWRLVQQRRRHAAVLLVLASVGAEALDQILKLLFRRARPSAFFDYHAMGYSFPSGHSVIACCFYGVVAAILTVKMRSRMRQAFTWAAAALLALTIGISRIYLGVHYPSDVLAGYAAAIVWVAGVRAGYEMWLRRRRRAAEDRGEPAL